MNLAGFKRFLGLSGVRTEAEVNTAISTVGAGTLTAAAMVGGLITRSGSTAAYTDTTATATDIIDAMANATVGQSWTLRIKNTVAFAETISGGTGVTVSGVSVVPPLSVGTFLITVTAAGTVTMVGVGTQPLSNLPVAKFATTAAASPLTAAAGDLTGAQHVFFEITTDGAFGLTTRTAVEMFADTPNAQVGQTYLLTVVNKGNNTVTITGGTDVTITATATLATLVTRTYVVTFATATTITMQDVIKGTIET